MPFTDDEKDELRLLIRQEISSAVKAGLREIMYNPISYFDLDEQSQKNRKEQKRILKEFTDVFERGLLKEENEAQAKMVEKTDPKRAAYIRKFTDDL